MAKLKGPLKIQGTLGDITFAKTTDGYIAKEKTSLDGKRIATDPSFQRTRENGAEFTRAGKAGKLLRNAVHGLLQNAKDNRVASRLTKEMMKVIKADASSPRGLRNVIDGEAEMLEGFEFNVKAKLGATLYVPYTTVIDRVTGTLTVSIPSFVPADKIIAPAGTTHFRIVSTGAEVDFEKENFITDSKDSGVIAWDSMATAVINLANAVSVNSTHPLFLVMGIQFYQQVAGINNPLKNGAFNALSVVKVSGV
jgi:hypothetical protein